MLIPVELLWAYLVAISLLTLTPGVDTLLVMRNTARGGMADGTATSLGICSGLFIHATLSALGISILLVETAWAFNLLKWAGAAYLVWLGFVSLRQAVKGADIGNSAQTPDVAPARAERRRFGLSFREGVLSNLLNPKTALFYMALLPQFIDPQGDAFVQSLFLAALHFILAMGWQCAVAFMVIKSRHLPFGQRSKRFLQALTGTFFVAIGVRLANQ